MDYEKQPLNYVCSRCYMSYSLLAASATHPSFDEIAGQFHRNPPSLTREDLDARSPISLFSNRKRHRNTAFSDAQNAQGKYAFAPTG